MENWENLNIILDNIREDEKRRVFLSELLVEEASKGNKENVKKVLQAGAHPNSFKSEYTPLIASLKGDFVELTNYLVNIGASPSYKPNNDFLDAVWYALLNNKYRALKKFIDVRTVLNKSPTGLTLLGQATETSDLQAVTILLNHYNIKVNERDIKGNTALHYNMKKTEMSSDDIQIGKLLLAAGASTMVKNNEGKTPSEMAAMAGESLILENDIINDIDNAQKNNPSTPTPNKGKTLKF
jgi:hypothetical protein